MKALLFQSANFKKDYVAAAAVILFMFIVFGEIALAIAIPSYLHHENTMILEVKRLKLLESFDHARNRCLRIKPRTTAAAMELQLISWNLDRIAYMRHDIKNMDIDDIARLQKAVNDSHAVLNVIEKGERRKASNGKMVRVVSISQEDELKTDIYVNSLIPKGRR
ncbi:MAG: hypothetical protein J6Y54_01010 [Lentisphaeria bacterium]|nr:hypothetical protein [Lentisphaeria bacterium]